jgi:hypothetical protein
MDIFTLGYAAAFVLFFGFEGWAIFNKTEGDTFSEKVRDYFHVKGKVGSFAFISAFGIFAAWFVAHIVQIPV